MILITWFHSDVRFHVQHGGGGVVMRVCLLLQVGGSRRPHVLSGRPSCPHLRLLLPPHCGHGGVLRRAALRPAAALLGTNSAP